jgi:cytochrome c oxidase subunit 3
MSEAALHEPGSHFHQFRSETEQRESASLGMWVFLATEVMFFGGLFMAYLLYRWKFPEAFAAASHHLDVLLGGINTAVLIGSSLTMALAVRAAQLGRRRLLTGFLAATMLLGLVFLGIKAYEYHHKHEEHLVPGPYFEFRFEQEALRRPAEIFFCLYFFMTGMHALHMVIGLGLMAWLVAGAARGRYGPRYYNPVECMGLYWHFVDIVWIFLFPLLYLVGAHVK